MLPETPPDLPPQPGHDPTAPASAPEGKGLFANNKTELALGAAAVLGLMLIYRWSEKKLAETDPEEYQRLKKLRSVLGKVVDAPIPAEPAAAAPAENDSRSGRPAGDPGDTGVEEKDLPAPSPAIRNEPQGGGAGGLKQR